MFAPEVHKVIVETVQTPSVCNTDVFRKLAEFPLETADFPVNVLLTKEWHGKILTKNVTDLACDSGLPLPKIRPKSELALEF